MKDDLQRRQITIKGRVQGVGCRPFIYRLARGSQLTGWVLNDTAGVTIQVQGAADRLDVFTQSLRDSSQDGYPALMTIADCRIETVETIPGESVFQINQSDAAGDPVSQVMPDCATCQACLSEMQDSADFRYRYPFINCTHCGPRYSIIQTIPYDRPNTTMSAFGMCDKCRAQYEDIADRRFHAQPAACPDCGPKIWLTDKSGATIETDSDAVIAKCAEILRKGGIAAIKGLGGFHLAVDALNEQAVCELRKRKRRDAKPFALMAASIAGIKKYGLIDAASEQLLKSPEAPIVLLDKKDSNAIAPSVADGTDRFGFMLPYTPLHHLLFAEAGIDVLVMTSANLSDEPLICRNDQAVDELGDIADVFLMHDRDIFRQVDDSVLQVVNLQPAMLRRSRGYVPTPIHRSQSTKVDIFAAGADLKNTFCFVRGNQYLMSEHIGDLADGRVYRHYTRSVEHLRKLFEVDPKVVVCDLHPGYLSTHFAEQFDGVGLLRVQHHWAHIASVLADFDQTGPVIGLVADGTGYGSDGAIWGCECLIVSLTAFDRFGQLAYYPLAGGDKASKEAVRPLVGLLGADGVSDNADLVAAIESDADKIQLILTQIEKGLNTTPTSSLGRLFDAAAALLGLGTRNRFEAELPIALEAVIKKGVDDAYPVELTDSRGVWKIGYKSLLQGMIADIRIGVDKGVIAARFHNSVCDSLLALAQKARDVHGLSDAALSGGVFCNRYLANRLIDRLQTDGFRVLWKKSVPVNDGGLSLGQAAIASEMIEQGLVKV